MRRFSLNQEHVISVLCFITAFVVLRLVADFPEGQQRQHLSGPAFFPRVLAAVFIITGIGEMITGFAKEEDHSPISMKELWKRVKSAYGINMLLVIALIVFFINFFNVLGFIITAFVVVFVTMWRLGVPWGKNLLVTVLLVGIIDLIFGYLFTISLPSGVLSVIGL